MKRKSVLERFTEKWVPDPKSGCWLWIASCNNKGYGNFGRNNKTAKAHRVAYELYRGPIPKGLTIDHLCRTRSCVNPNHMEIVSLKINILRGYAPSANHARKTHCVHGHPFDGKNLGLYKKRRFCRTCKNERSRSYYHQEFKTHNL